MSFLWLIRRLSRVYWIFCVCLRLGGFLDCVMLLWRFFERFLKIRRFLFRRRLVVKVVSF